MQNQDNTPMRASRHAATFAALQSATRAARAGLPYLPPGPCAQPASPEALNPAWHDLPVYKPPSSPTTAPTRPTPAPPDAPTPRFVVHKAPQWRPASLVGFIHSNSLGDLLHLAVPPCTVFVDLDRTLVVRNKRRLSLTEPQTADIVRQLQARDGVRVVGLTARPFFHRGRDRAKTTDKELRDLGIDLSQNTADVQPMPIDPRSGIGFRAGCAYTGNQITKGEMAKCLATRLKSDMIIMVDDLTENLDSVAQYAAAAGIAYLGVHYTRILSGEDKGKEDDGWRIVCDPWCTLGAYLVTHYSPAALPSQASSVMLQPNPSMASASRGPSVP